MGNPAT
jgi:hypothetical protein